MAPSRLLAAAALLAAGAGCRRGTEREVPAAAVRPATPDHLPGPLPRFDELAFVPSDVEAVLRADLHALGAADPSFALVWPGALAHERPELAALLARAGIAIPDIDRLYFAVGADFGNSGAYLAAITGPFESARVADALARTGAASSDIDGVRVWRVRLGEGAGGVALAPGIVVAGALPLVERSAALLAAAAQGRPTTDVRSGALADELGAIDPDAHGFAAARLGPATRARLGQEASGLSQLRLDFTRRDGRVRIALRLAFTDEANARAAEARLRALTQGAERTRASLGVIAAWLDPALEITRAGAVVSARVVL